MNEFKRIINHFTDNDLYTFTVMYYAMLCYPNAEVRYEFNDRNKTVYPKGFDKLLMQQVECMASIRITTKEVSFMRRECPYFPEWFFTYLYGYVFNPKEVSISQDEEGHLSITIQGPWQSAIMWEVPLLATISEFLHDVNGDIGNADLEFTYKHQSKRIENAFKSPIRLSEMGTRRRFSFEAQERVIQALIEKNENGNLLGTSNVYFAMKYGLKPIGTMSHQVYSFEECASDVEHCNPNVLTKWKRVYGNNLRVALPDTFGTDVFLKTVPPELLAEYGVRIDSGVEDDEIKKFDEAYLAIDILPSDRLKILSNALTLETAADFSARYDGKSLISAGIGTDLTATVFSVGTHEKFRHSNIVIKLTGMRLSQQDEWKNGIKLSCDTGKAIGDPVRVEEVKRKIAELLGR